MNFYFYDLETSGFYPRNARIMQFGGQRTNMDLKPIGEPDNVLVKLTDDVLPEPDAVLVHGITPQKSKAEGINEAEFLKYLTSKVFLPNTIFVGFNNIRFDDEFMRFTLWRNFYDSYEWEWKNSCSRWDILDVARMTRALRPDGIKWPFDSEGKPSNRLELLSSINKLDHADAHDALSDVKATIAVAQLIKQKQPKLFDYLLKIRDKTKVAVLVGKSEPFIYTSGYYPGEYEKTTIAVMVANHPGKQAALVYDLRIDPTPFLSMTPDELASAWKTRPAHNMHASAAQGTGEQQTKPYMEYGEGAAQPATQRSAASDSRAAGSASRQAGTMHGVGYFPVKTLSYNRCPAVAPLSVLDGSGATRLNIDRKNMDANFIKLKKAKDFGNKLAQAIEIIQPKVQPEMVVDPQKVDSQLYDSFITDADRVKASVVRAAGANELSRLRLDFADERLKVLLPIYKARNYPQSLSAKEQKWWEEFRRQRLLGGKDSSRAAYYFKRIKELGTLPNLSGQAKYLLEELNLYGQSIIPEA